jgi:hypothetical protein
LLSSKRTIYNNVNKKMIAIGKSKENKSPLLILGRVELILAD